MAKTQMPGSRPTIAAITRGTKLSAWHVAQTTTQRRCEPSLRTAAGDASCSRAPAIIGTEATRPETTSPIPKARAKAGKYVSPMPTISEKPSPSPRLARKSLRSVGE